MSDDNIIDLNKRRKQKTELSETGSFAVWPADEPDNIGLVGLDIQLDLAEEECAFIEPDDAMELGEYLIRAALTAKAKAGRG